MLTLAAAASVKSVLSVRVCVLHCRLDEALKDKRVQRLGQEQFKPWLDSACNYVRRAAEAYRHSSDLAELRKLVSKLEEDISEIQQEMEGTIEVDDADVAGGASKKDVVHLLLTTRQEGETTMSVAQAVWALKRAKGHRSSAAQMLHYLPLARRVVAALREPGTLSDFELAAVSHTTKERVAMALKAGSTNLRKQAESFLKVTWTTRSQPADSSRLAPASLPVAPPSQPLAPATPNHDCAR